MLFVKMYRNKGNKNEEKLIILNVLMVFQNNQLMDDLINPFLDTLKAMALVGIPFTAAFCIYGIGDDYYWEHIASIEAVIKQKEESLKHPNLQTEYWQRRLTKEMAELKERLKKEQEAKKNKEAEKEIQKQKAEPTINEQKPINILSPQAANAREGSHNDPKPKL